MTYLFVMLNGQTWHIDVLTDHFVIIIILRRIFYNSLRKNNYLSGERALEIIKLLFKKIIKLHLLKKKKRDTCLRLSIFFVVLFVFSNLRLQQTLNANKFHFLSLLKSIIHVLLMIIVHEKCAYPFRYQGVWLDCVNAFH